VKAGLPFLYYIGSQMKRNIYIQIERIRQLINNTRKRFSLLKDKKLWNQLCSSLDVINDTALAIVAYEQGQFPKVDGEKYLRLYGLLQALFLQQEAVKHLSESLGMPVDLSKYPKLMEIREVRNCSIGHPSKLDRPKNKPQSFHFVSRITINKLGFMLLSFYENGQYKSERVSITELLTNQAKYLSEILRGLIDALDKEEKEHRKMFRMKKLERLFPDSLSYDLSKIWEAAKVGDRNIAVAGTASLAQICQVLKTFEASLAKRGLAVNENAGVKSIYDELQYPIEELIKFFKTKENGSNTEIRDKAACIFADFVKGKVLELREMAREIDDGYNS